MSFFMNLKLNCQQVKGFIGFITFYSLRAIKYYFLSFQESFLAESFLALVHYAKDNLEATAAGLLSIVKQCDGKYGMSLFSI